MRIGPTIIIPFIVLALLAVACAPLDNTANATNTTATGATLTGDVAANLPSEPGAPPAVPGTTEATNATGTAAAPQDAAAGNDLYTVTGTEGDLIQLKPQAIDPDGNPITYTFTKPFDSDGRWQTAIGDQGTYDVVVGASDGKSLTTETVRVVVLRANRPPVINCKPVVVNEGQLLDLHSFCTVTDEDDPQVIVTYSGWMDSWRYLTAYGDAGTHTVIITASDVQNKTSLHTVTQNVTVTVMKTNRPPVFSPAFPVEIDGTENDVITIPTRMVTDPDGNPLTFTFSPPFDKNGVWQTKVGDAGSYNVDVAASDGTSTVKRTITVKIAVLVTPPVLKTIPDITVNEGQTIKLPIDAYDRSGYPLTTIISGWMNSDTYTTTYDDAGNYTVRVTVGNGQFNTTQLVHIQVIDVNRPPVFIVPA